MAVEFLPITIAGGGAYTPGLVANNNVVSTVEDTPVSGNLLTDDVANEGTLSIKRFEIAGAEDWYAPGATEVIVGAAGTIVLASNGAYTFTPNQDYTGTVPVLTYYVSNGSEIRLATLAITVTDANDAPTASGDYGLSFDGEDVIVNPLANDTDPDSGDVLTMTLINGSPWVAETPITIANAVITPHADSTITVNPTAAFEGEITFTYTISDGEFTATGTVTVQVGVENLSMFSPATPITTALDQAAVNFGLTYRGLYGDTYGNGVNVSIPPYSAGQGLFTLTNREPWLYDRATTLYKLYLRTADPAILADAKLLAETYMTSLVVTGGGAGAQFQVYGGAAGAEPTDVKYLYGIIPVWYEREFATDVYRSRSQAIYNQTLISFTQTWDAGSAELWTERNAGYSIQNCLSWYWLSGDTAALAAAEAYFADILLMSVGSGAPLHGHNQHEGSAITTLISSPWMGSILAESAVQLYRTNSDPDILTWLSGYGDFIHDNAVYTVATPDEPEFADLVGLRLPAYLAGTALQFPEGQAADVQHAVDVAGLIRKAIWAKEQLSLSTVDLVSLRNDLEAAALVDIAYWTRTTEGYPRYRVNPPRKYAWQMHGTYSRVIYAGVVPFPPINVATPTISGSTQQGQTLTVTPGTWNGTPAPTLTYQWYREGVAISGSTATTYVTQALDVAQTITCRETATNTGGSAFENSNGIDVVPAGAPEVTVHPTNATATVGETEQFTATCTATPTATYQWQVSTTAVPAWTNVAEGTGGAGTGNTTTYTTETLASDDAADQYRCAFTNGGGTVYTNAALLSLVQDQASVRFNGDTAGAFLNYALGANGHTNFTVEFLVYLEQRNPSAVIIELGHTGNGRAVYIQHDNVFEQNLPTIGDTQTGVSQGATPDWALGVNPPPLNTWLFMTLRSPVTANGTLVATWQLAEGAVATAYYADRANGVESSVPALRIALNGSGSGVNGAGNGLIARFQFVRGQSAYLANATVEGHRNSNDTTGWDFWWNFHNNGGGGIAVTDETGNGRVPTITNGTLATGPVVPGF